MDRQGIFDRALFEKQTGGIIMIVILDVICLIFSPLYGRMRFDAVGGILLLINMMGTCILYHNFILSRGEIGFELNTEKMVYFPTTRQRFLMNKYAKTLIFMVIQLILTIVCLGFGKLSSRGEMANSRFLSGCLIVLIGILCTSGVAILVMHLTPYGVYLPMILFYPLFLLTRWFSISVTAIAFILWLFLLFIGIKIYEKVT